MLIRNNGPRTRKQAEARPGWFLLADPKPGWGGFGRFASFAYWPASMRVSSAAAVLVLAFTELFGSGSYTDRFGLDGPSCR